MEAVMNEAIIDMKPVEKLTDSELELINELITDARAAQAMADKFANKLVVKHKLKLNDSLDWTTGVINRG